MDILDIHTHHTPENSFTAIVNVTAEEFSLFQQKKGYCSVGYHPWYLSPDGEEKWALLESMAGQPEVLAIGEAGLDKLTRVDFSLQLSAFRRQIELSEYVKKPLIIHAVRSFNELVRLKRELKPALPWIIHGFRGKKEAALELIGHGFYLSFGEKYQEESLKTIPVDKLFLETDESMLPILSLYQKASSLLDLPLNELTERVQRNISRLFFAD